MAVDWRHLIFGDVDSADYGIYISGDGVYNAPERDVEFVPIPGRNGDIAMDNGRYNNITVTYPAGTFAKTQEEFREKLSDFRNAVLSQKGYQRLEDTYHPEEFRMAVYTAGLEVDPVAYQQAGEFELTFNCKPQRWLSVGALPIPVDSGDVLQNPTVFDSSPLLEVEGYGDISFNGFNIALDNNPMGNVTLIPRHSYGTQGTFTKTYKFDRSLLNTGDTITVGASIYEFIWNSSPAVIYSSYTYTVASGSSYRPTVTIGDGGSVFFVTLSAPAIPFTALAQGASEVDRFTQVAINATVQGGGTHTVYITVHTKCGYDYITYSTVVSTSSPVGLVESSMNTSQVYGNSTIMVLGNPTYIDCELGEAYRIEDGKYKSSNARVSIGADLPTLAPGSNKITFDDTITDLKIAPRWWKV